MIHAEDAKLFQEVQDALASLPPDADQSDERRTTLRDSFVTMQFIAPYDGESLPHQTELRLVPFVDLSPNGFSFVFRETPTFERLVVMLGRVPMKAFSARIRNVMEMPGGEGLFKIGCELEGRL